GAARTGAVRGGAMVVELQRHADDIVTLALEDRGDDGRVDAARHGDDHAGIFWTSWKVETVHRFFVVRRAVSGIGRRLHCRPKQYRSSGRAALWSFACWWPRDREPASPPV